MHNECYTSLELSHSDDFPLRQSCFPLAVRAATVRSAATIAANENLLMSYLTARPAAQSGTAAKQSSRLTSSHLGDAAQQLPRLLPTQHAGRCMCGDSLANLAQRQRRLLALERQRAAVDADVLLGVDAGAAHDVDASRPPRPRRLRQGTRGDFTAAQCFPTPAMLQSIVTDWPICGSRVRQVQMAQSPSHHLCW